MHIVFDTVEPREKDIIEKALTGHTLTFLDKSVTADTVLPPDTDMLSVFVSSVVTKNHIDSLPNLKLISTRSMGFDHIDIVAAKARNIPVTCVPAYGTHTVAEFTFALMFALTRKIIPAYFRLKDAHSVDSRASEGFDIHGKTLGVIGTGKIGKNVARYGKAFGMEVVLYDVFKDDAFAQDLGVPYLSLDELVAKSDILSLHVPLLPTTTHLINADVLSKTKRGAILINTARGGVVDTVALKNALESGQLSGAGLDVFEGEKEIFGADAGKEVKSAEAQASLALLAMPNVIMTPHVAYDTIEAKLEILNTSLGNITNFLAGKPSNLVV